MSGAVNYACMRISFVYWWIELFLWSVYTFITDSEFRANWFDGVMQVSMPSMDSDEMLSEGRVRAICWYLKLDADEFIEHLAAAQQEDESNEDQRNARAH